MSEPPSEWSLVIGEFAQNVRSSLNYLLGQLVELNGQEPGYWSQFPIYSQLPDRSRFRRMIKGVSEAHATEIERLQPYLAPDPGARALDLLASFSNVDKHQALIPYAVMGGELTDASFRIIPQQECRFVEVVRPVYAGTPIAEAEIVFRVDPPDTRIDIALDKHLTLELGVIFGQPGVPLAGLDDIIEEVQRILDLFAPSFG